jgi:intracellular septation protein A
VGGKGQGDQAIAKPITPRHVAMTWARRLKRVFGIEINTCTGCGGQLKVLASIVVQRFVKVDLLGGLALFGVAVLCVSAAFAWFFQDDWAIKMRSTIIGGLIAAVMFGDALFNHGRYLGGRLARFMPNPIDTRRMAAGLAGLGVVMALLDWGVARFFSKDIWLAYTSFGDIALSVLLAMAVIRFAERPAAA